MDSKKVDKEGKQADGACYYFRAEDRVNVWLPLLVQLHSIPAESALSLYLADICSKIRCIALELNKDKLIYWNSKNYLMKMTVDFGSLSQYMFTDREITTKGLDTVECLHNDYMLKTLLEAQLDTLWSTLDFAKLNKLFLEYRIDEAKQLLKQELMRSFMSGESREQVFKRFEDAIRIASGDDAADRFRDEVNKPAGDAASKRDKANVQDPMEGENAVKRFEDMIRQAAGDEAADRFKRQVNADKVVSSKKADEK